MTIPPRSTLMDFSSLEDSDLMRLIAAQQTQALEALYARYGQRVFSLALSVVENAALAEEITRYVFLQTWREARSPHAEANEAYSRLTTLLTSDLQQRGILDENSGMDALNRDGLGREAQPEALPPSLKKRILDEISKSQGGM